MDSLIEDAFVDKSAVVEVVTKHIHDVLGREGLSLTGSNSFTVEPESNVTAAAGAGQVLRKCLLDQGEDQGIWLGDLGLGVVDIA
ncbi:hypothetical protein IT575_12680 [bacterium]|nr:hypothetical protein [bacterium]